MTAAAAARAAARPLGGRFDRIIVLGLLGLLAAVCWAYLLFRTGVRLGAAPVASGAAIHPGAAPWRLPDAGRLAALWIVIVAALMLPAAAPQVATYARVRRARRERWVIPHVFVFLLGCVAVWCGCALGAGAIGWLLHDTGALDDNLAIARPTAGALAMVGAGVYQWTPAKHACLDNGREPLAFVLTQWRRGPWGALRMGVADARSSIGCCWPLLALLLPAGAMNLPVIGGLAVLILAERRLPGGHLLACATGLGLVAWGTALLFP